MSDQKIQQIFRLIAHLTKLQHRPTAGSTINVVAANCRHYHTQNENKCQTESNSHVYTQTPAANDVT